MNAKNVQLPSRDDSRGFQRPQRRQQPQPYKVRRIHVVAKGADVLVREYTLDPGEFIPWHHHTDVADYYYGLEGTVRIETRNPAARHEVASGHVANVTPPTAHRIPARHPAASC
jgi:quercetin dioxygenase-like cupin family protein